ncbi:unnamed protein product [Meloidogyne enterolobii]|uniref:Uncharacterized protein n=1 Tax=Meloidogyne enterolobii TaxID=390850 RepID=A0ACB1ATP5_MELEN
MRESFLFSLLPSILALPLLSLVSVFSSIIFRLPFVLFKIQPIPYPVLLDNNSTYFFTVEIILCPMIPIFLLLFAKVSLPFQNNFGLTLSSLKPSDNYPIIN